MTVAKNVFEDNPRKKLPNPLILTCIVLFGSLFSLLIFNYFHASMQENNDAQIESEIEKDIEHTPSNSPESFDSVKRSKAKKHKETGEIWEPDLLHKDHWEVYKNKKDWEKGKRDRSVWNDGRLKERY